MDSAGSVVIHDDVEQDEELSISALDGAVDIPLNIVDALNVDLPVLETIVSGGESPIEMAAAKDPDAVLHALTSKSDPPDHPRAHNKAASESAVKSTNTTKTTNTMKATK